MVPLIISLSVVFGLLVFLFLVVYILYRITYYSPFRKQLNDQNLLHSKNYQSYSKIRKKLIDELMSRPYKDAYITSFDGLKLHARVFATRGSNGKVAILTHGYRGSAYRDFAAASKVLFELKYNIILIDQRAHGLSGGHKITFGIRESKDLLDWISYAKKKFGDETEMLLFGASMGGNTVLNIADKIDEHIKIIADSPFTSPKEIIKNSIKAIHLPTSIVYPLTNLAAIIYTHENMSRHTAIEAVDKSKNKILIIHGRADKIVPYEDSMLLSAKYNHRIKYVLFNEGQHITSYLVDFKKYKKAIVDFLK